MIIHLRGISQTRKHKKPIYIGFINYNDKTYGSIIIRGFNHKYEVYIKNKFNWLIHTYYSDSVSEGVEKILDHFNIKSEFKIQYDNSRIHI